MLIRRARRFTSNEITDAKLYLSRREWMIGAALLTLLPGESGAATPQGQPLGEAGGTNLLRGGAMVVGNAKKCQP